MYVFAVCEHLREKNIYLVPALHKFLMLIEISGKKEIKHHICYSLLIFTGMMTGMTSEVDMLLYYAWLFIHICTVHVYIAAISII